MRPLPPVFRPIYSRSTSLFGWKFPVTDNIFLVLISISLISCIVQSSIPIVGVITGVAKALCAIVLLKADSSDDHILFTQERYSFETLSLLIVPSYAIFLSWPRYR